MVETRIVGDAARDAEFDTFHAARARAIAAVEASVTDHLHGEGQCSAHGFNGGGRKEALNLKSHHFAGAVFSEFGKELKAAFFGALRDWLREWVAELLGVVTSVPERVIAEFDTLARGDSGTGVCWNVPTCEARPALQAAAGGFAKSDGRVREVVVLAGFGGGGIHGVCCVVLCCALLVGALKGRK